MDPPVGDSTRLARPPAPSRDAAGASSPTPSTTGGRQRVWCPCFKTEHFELLDEALEGEQGAGWLWKRGKRIRAWVKRWFVLKDAQLYYFTDSTRQKCKGTFCIVNATVQQVPKEGGRYTFELNHRNYETKHFSTPSKLQMDQWVTGLTAVIQQAKDEGSRDGFLQQRHQRTWQSRWVVVHCGELRLYVAPRDHECTLYLNLRGCEVRRTISDSGCFAFELRARDPVTGHNIRNEFAAEDYSSRERWIEALYKQSNREKTRGQSMSTAAPNAACDEDDEDEDEDEPVLQQLSTPTTPCSSAMPKDDGTPGRSPASAPLPLPHPFVRRSSSKRLSAERPPDPLCGFMLKKTHAAGAKGFQKRWFEVRYPGMLYYYKHKPEDGARAMPKGSIALVDLVEGSPRLGDNGHDLHVEVHTSAVVPPVRVFHIRCAGKDEAEKWHTGLRDWAAFAVLCSKRLGEQYQPSSSQSSFNQLLLQPATDRHEAFRRLASMLLKEDGAKAGVL